MLVSVAMSQKELEDPRMQILLIFLDNALGSANEVETQLLISKNIGYITEEIFNQLMVNLTGIQKQLTGLIASIRN